NPRFPKGTERAPSPWLFFVRAPSSRRHLHRRAFPHHLVQPSRLISLQFGLFGQSPVSVRRVSTEGEDTTPSAREVRDEVQHTGSDRDRGIDGLHMAGRHGGDILRQAIGGWL